MLRTPATLRLIAAERALGLNRPQARAPAERYTPAERRDLALIHLARAARLWPPALAARRAEVLAELAADYPEQLRTPHILCLARAAAANEERIAIATALLAGTEHQVTRRSTP